MDGGAAGTPVMRVAVEATGVAPGGGLSFLRGALPALAKRGDLELDVFVGPGVARECFGSRVRPLVVGPFRGLGHRLAWVQSVFPRLVAGYDVVFAPGNVAPLAVASKTVLFIQNAHVVPQSAWRAEYRTCRRRLQRLMARLSIRRAGRVLFISETLKAWARPCWAANRLEPTVAHPGVTLAAEVRSATDAGQDVLVVGNLVPHKRVDRAVQAFARFTRQSAYCGRLRIAGGEGAPGILRRLRQTAERHGIADRVEFVGFLRADALARAYVAGGCYLSTSALEALPLPRLEALAAGTPVVVPDSASFREVCGPAGIYCSNDDEIVKGVALALDHASGGDDLQRAARERAAGFSWPAFAERLNTALVAVAFPEDRDLAGDYRDGSQP